MTPRLYPLCSRCKQFITDGSESIFWVEHGPLAEKLRASQVQPRFQLCVGCSDLVVDLLRAWDGDAEAIVNAGVPAIK